VKTVKAVKFQLEKFAADLAMTSAALFSSLERERRWPGLRYSRNTDRLELRVATSESDPYPTLGSAAGIIAVAFASAESTM
jgi:hypothetical protein